MSTETTRYVFEYCDIKKELPFIDVKKLSDGIKTQFTEPRIEYLRSSNTKNFTLDKEWTEHIVTKSIVGGEFVGAGNGPIDVRHSNTGIDVGCVCINGRWSNEKSIMQNFKICGNRLDSLFGEGKDEEALNSFKQCYINKLAKIKEMYIYYLIFMSKGEDIYCAGLKLNREAVKNIKSGGFVTGHKKSIKCINFIDENIGKVTLYKAKKRFEIRFSNSIIKMPYTIKVF